MLTSLLVLCGMSLGTQCFPLQEDVRTELPNSEIIPKSSIVKADISLEDFAEDLTAFIHNLTACTGVSGSTVSVVNQGQTIFTGGFGLRDIERELPVQDSTLFGIGSTSKAFTSALLGMLVDDGLLDFTSPVTDFQANFSLPQDERHQSECRTNQASLSDLMAHRTGSSTLRFSLFFLDETSIDRGVKVR